MTNEFASLALILCAWFISAPFLALVIKLMRDVGKLLAEASTLNEKFERLERIYGENTPRE